LHLLVLVSAFALQWIGVLALPTRALQAVGDTQEPKCNKKH